PITASGATSPDYAITFVSGTLTVTPGPPTVLVVSAGDHQTAPAGTRVGTPPAVLVQDAFGNPVPGVAVTFAVASGGGSIMGATAPWGVRGLPHGRRGRPPGAPGPGARPRPQTPPPPPRRAWPAAPCPSPPRPSPAPPPSWPSPPSPAPPSPASPSAPPSPSS